MAARPQQTEPDDRPPEHVGYLISRIDRLSRRMLAERLQPLELSWPAYTVLSFLDRQPGMSGAALARRALVSPQAINEIIATLVTRGLVKRSVDPDHGRIRQMHITESGFDLLAQARAQVEIQESELLAGISESERRQLLDLLYACADNLGAGYDVVMPPNRARAASS